MFLNFNLKSSFRFLIISLGTFVLFSCNSSKKVIYLQDAPSSPISDVRITEYAFTEPVIQPDDILSILIQTIDPQANTIINQVSSPIPSIGASSANVIGTQVTSGFIVDKEGFVEMPMIGKVKLGGLSTFNARDLIREKASEYIKNPTVLVRYANYKITVLGEVVKPGTFVMPNEKVSILDVIGLAGDLTIYGNRRNVLLIREVNGVKEFARFDLKSTEIFKSPYYYLKQNDVIYVEPTNPKVATTNVARIQLYSLIASTLSFLIILLRYSSAK